MKFWDEEIEEIITVEVIKKIASQYLVTVKEKGRSKLNVPKRQVGLYILQKSSTLTTLRGRKKQQQDQDYKT